MIELPTEAEPVRVIQGDALDVLRQLPDGCVDAVITDPPYGLDELWAGGGGSAKSTWVFRPEEARSWDRCVTQEAMDAVLSLMVPSVIWGGNCYALPPSRCWFIWDKKQPDTWTTGQAEMAWTNVERPTRVFRKAQCEVHDEMRPKLHPTQKPLSLIRWCVRMMRLPKDAVILDPFAGSGTTGHAAIAEGRRAILIEKEPRYVAIAQRRIDEAMGRGAGSLFAEAV